MMRILFPTLARFPSHEAPAIQVANMAQAFAELGHDVTLVVPAPTVDGTPVADLPADELFGFAPRFRVATLSRTIHRGQSYLHALRIARMAHGVDLLFSRNLRACLLPALRGVPTVFEAHTLSGIDGPQDRWVLGRLLRAPGLRGIVAISAALAEDLTGVLGVPADRILVAHDAVRLPTEVEAPTAAVAEPGTPSTLDVGYTGSMFQGRGVELLIALVEREPRVTLHLVGGPVDRAEAWRDRAEAAASDRIVVHGPVAPAAARRLQRSVDVLVAPFARRVLTDSGVDSSRWMSPMKVFEYMASGRPIVISDLPVLREVLRPDVDALMVTPEDIDALVGAVARLADDPGLRDRLATSALERVRAEFTWERRARRIIERFVPEHAGPRVG